MAMVTSRTTDVIVGVLPRLVRDGILDRGYYPARFELFSHFRRDAIPFPSGPEGGTSCADQKGRPAVEERVSMVVDGPPAGRLDAVKTVEDVTELSLVVGASLPGLVAGVDWNPAQSSRHGPTQSPVGEDAEYTS
jgi:hypothetical protein